MSDWKKELRELVELKEMGAITQEQFEEMRDNIIASNNPGLSGSTTVQTADEPSPNPLSGATRVEPEISLPTGGLSGATTVSGQVAPDPQTNENADSIGQYNIIKELGEGGMGTVLLGRHKEAAYAKAQGDVAIKLMHPQFADDPTFRERFIQEAALGEKINHPNIANVRELLTNEHLGLVMEYVAGDDLSELIPADGLPIERALEVLKPLASALDFLHEKGIIHRDMKPSNVKIKPDGTPVILDFGIAKQQNAGQGMTRTGTAMGTIAYMAPEQMNAKNVTGAADQYALAMMAYELLSGGYPWNEEDTEFQVTNLKLSSKLPALSDRKPAISSAISEIVQKGMSSKAEDRYESCTAFVIALSEAAKSASQEQPTLARRKRPHTVVVANSELEPSAPEKPQPQPKSSEQPRRSPRPSPVLVEPPKPEEKAASEAPSPEVTAPKSKMGLVVGGVLGLVLVVGGGVMLMPTERAVSVTLQGFGKAQPEVLIDGVSFPSGSPLSFGTHELKVKGCDKARRITVEKGEGIQEETYGVGDCGETTLKLDGATDAVLIPAGEFTMGCTSEQGEDCYDSEKPTHSVTISGSFFMIKSEVTQMLYEKVMGKNPSSFSSCGIYCPVESVTWYDAVRFANKLSEKEGLESCYSISDSQIDSSKVGTDNSGESAKVSFKEVSCSGWRLPTEAEWEYAARGGQSTKYAGSNDLGSVAWYDENSESKTHAVCGKAKNKYGLCDMSGNVYEWVWDWKGKYKESSQVDPLGPSSGTSRAFRGGSWFYGARLARVSDRYDRQPSARNGTVGFRVLRTFP